MKRWIYKKYSVTSAETAALSHRCGINPAAACVLLNRGIDTEEKVNKFLNISVNDFEDAALLDGIEAVADRIETALAKNERIIVYGDYDVDGITSVGVMLSYLRERGAKADYYIPSRIDEGYGLNSRALKKIRFNGNKLVITVDTGITATDEVEFAKIINLDIVITDHHQCKEQLPDCPLINPHVGNYPFKNLAGVGVVFKLISYMEKNNPQKILDKYGDLVALGTIADVVSLTGENRIIVGCGLEKLKENPNHGLKKLLNTAISGTRDIDASTVGFAIAPRINAAGRIGDTSKAVDLLLTDDDETREKAALYLEEQNRLRQKTEQDILKNVLEIAESDEYKNKKVLVLHGNNWHHGVIGIVASRVTEKYHKPCILISCEDGIGKGSGRSIKGFNLFDALSACGDIFVKFGGHELAAGLTLSEENIPVLDKRLNEFADINTDEECFKPYIEIDSELPTEFINKSTVESLNMLKPFGTDNPGPIFSVCGAKLIRKRSMSEGKHAAFMLEKQGCAFETVLFGGGELYDCFDEGDTVDTVGIIQINSWNNTDKIQIIAKEIRISGIPCGVPQEITREDLAAVYRFLKKYSAGGVLKGNPEALAHRTCREYSAELDGEKFLNILMVFAELKLLTYIENNTTVDIYMLNCTEKVNLGSSKILAKLNRKGEIR